MKTSNDAEIIRKSVGIVTYQDFTLSLDQCLELESGKKLYGLNLRYECYGQLNDKKSNAILVIHALTGNHHAAGRYRNEDRVSGWWDDMIGPGKAFDTDHFFVLCINNLGGCSGTTGPNSINPQTEKPYGLTFPIITIADMVKAQILLLDHLGITRLYAAAGGSMGAMMALHLSVHYPERIANVISIASTACQNAQSIAFSEVSRQAIMRDPHFYGGDYAAQNSPGPKNGLAVARMLAHITYLSDHSMRNKFGRRLQGKENFDLTFDVEFEVESYLRYQGAKFTDRFDANSYLYLTKALNYFDLTQGFPSLSEAFRRSQARYLVISFSTDWLYPSYMSEEMVTALIQAGKPCSYTEISTEAGHDAFLLEWKRVTAIIRNFFSGMNSPQKTVDQKERISSPLENLNQDRRDFEIIASWVKPGSRVLDLGCGDGTLLDTIRKSQQRSDHFQGIEKDWEAALATLNRGLPVLNGKIDHHLNLITEESFDMIILSKTVQELIDPHEIITKILSKGKTVVISFLNYGYWFNRIFFSLRGRRPMNEVLPFGWYNSPDLHPLSIKDFEDYCEREGITILKKVYLKADWVRVHRFLPNLFAGCALYQLEKNKKKNS